MSALENCLLWIGISVVSGFILTAFIGVDPTTGIWLPIVIATIAVIVINWWFFNLSAPTNPNGSGESRSEYIERVRAEFEKLKTTSGFKKWYAEQYNIQKRKCAYCPKQIKFRRSMYGTNIEHIKPLYNFGTNEPKNLVISCYTCNKNKGRDDNKIRPSWIGENKYDESLMSEVKKMDEANRLNIDNKKLLDNNSRKADYIDGVNEHKGEDESLMSIKEQKIKEKTERPKRNKLISINIKED